MCGQGDSSISKSSSEFLGYIHKTTPRFWDGYQRLPPTVQKLANKYSTLPVQQKFDFHVSMCYNF